MKQLTIALVWLGICTVSGMKYNSYLCEHLNVNEGTLSFLFMPSTEIGNGLMNLLGNTCRLFGASDKTAELLSLNGINKALAVVYLLFMVAFVPSQLFRKFKVLRSERQRAFIVFSTISTLAVCYLFIFCNMTNARYLLWCYFYAIVNLGIWIDNYRKMKYEYEKEIKVLFVLFALVFAGGIYTYYITYDYETNPDVLAVNNTYRDYQVDYSLLEYLEENGYKYGYSDYWISYSGYVATDGKVKMGSLTYDWKQPYYWLNSDQWYRANNHKGNVFLLIPTKKLVDLPDAYKKGIIKKDEYKDYTIYTYRNIKAMQRIWRQNR